MSTDSDLLRRFAEQSSEEAFNEFVRRHVDLVYHAALRQLHGDTHRARDVTQMVFTDVARKAHAIARHPEIVSWLHRCTRYAVSNTRRIEATRQKHEVATEAPEALPEPVQEPRWERLRPILDEALLELKTRDREAVLLRFFEGRSFAEIGMALGVGENGARMRVERALDKLHGLLVRRGITSTRSALAALLAEQSAGAAPAGFAASVAATAISGAGGGGATPGMLASLLGLLLGGNTTLMLTLAGTTGVAAALYETTQARAAATSLAIARSEFTALQAQLANLDRQGPTNASAALGAKPVAPPAAPAVVNRAASSSAKTTPTAPPATPPLAKSKSWLQFSDNDPELWQLRLELTRIQFMTGPGMFLKSLGFTREQIGQAAEIEVQNRIAEKAAREAGNPPPKRDPSQFRELFGEAALAQLARWNQRSPENQLVNTISSKLFFADAPFTRDQAQSLAEIIAHTRLPHSPKTTSAQTLKSFIDWEKVIAEAEPILSAVQMKGLRNEAILARLSGLEPSRTPRAPAPP